MHTRRQADTLTDRRIHTSASLAVVACKSRAASATIRSKSSGEKRRAGDVVVVVVVVVVGAAAAAPPPPPLSVSPPLPLLLPAGRSFCSKPSMTRTGANDLRLWRLSSTRCHSACPAPVHTVVIWGNGETTKRPRRRRRANERARSRAEVVRACRHTISVETISNTHTRARAHAQHCLGTCFTSSHRRTNLLRHFGGELHEAEPVQNQAVHFVVAAWGVALGACPVDGEPHD